MTSTSPFNGRSTADEVLAGKDLTGQRIIVTGANTGIGYETARALAAAGASVTLACRKPGRAAATLQRIEASHPGCSVEVLPLDLASLHSVRDFCEHFPHQHVDTIICNAGLISPKYTETADGFEQTVAVCHIGHFLLVQLLMPRLLAAPAPRIIMLSSESHRMPARLNFGALPYPEDKFSVMKAYGQAKLCNALMAVELQRRYGDQGLTACYVHPGTMVTTDIGHDTSWARLAMKLARPFTKTAHQGAATTAFCASWDDTAYLGGNYFSHCKRAKPSAETANAEAASRLWDITQEWLDGAAV